MENDQRKAPLLDPALSLPEQSKLPGGVNRVDRTYLKWTLFLQVISILKEFRNIKVVEVNPALVVELPNKEENVIAGDQVERLFQKLIMIIVDLCQVQVRITPYQDSDMKRDDRQLYLIDLH